MDNGDGLRSGASSPSFDWGLVEGSGLDPVPLFDSNSVESVEPSPLVRTHQNNCTAYDTSGEQRGEKRSSGLLADDMMDSMPTITRRKKKAKGMPKRPMNPYALFFQQERTKLVDADGTSKRLSYEELERIIGMRWRDLSSAERKDFEVLAAQDGERYRNEMESYNYDKKHRKEEKVALFLLLPNCSFLCYQPLQPRPPVSQTQY